MIKPRFAPWLAALIMLGGCARYHAEPLSLSPPLAKDAAALAVRMDAPHYAHLFGVSRSYTVDIHDGLDEMEVVILAVLNNPQLKATRKRLHVATAQLFAAGLLPDPQIGIEQQKPTIKPRQYINGYTYNLGFDIRSLITRPAKVAAGRATARQVSMDVLWAEWQVVQQARLLFIRQHIQQQLVNLLSQQQTQSATLYRHVHELLRRHNTTLDQMGIALGSLLDVESALSDARRRLNKTRMSLALLLGLSPDARLPLAGLSEHYVPVPDPVLQQAVGRLAEFRPDLLALRAGYASQDARLRQAILSQFPNISIGISRQRDTSGVWSVGPLINMSLPVLNINRGNVAVAEATRARLHAEFKARMASAVIDIARIHRDQAIAYRLWQRMQVDIPQLANVQQKAFKALMSGNMELLNYNTIRNAYMTQRIKQLSLQQGLLEQQVALSTLLGKPTSGLPEPR
jgi:outer membrane protein TolC